MHEMHLRQPGFMYSVCGPFTKNKEQIQKIKETRDSRYIYRSELDRACFQHDLAYIYLTLYLFKQKIFDVKELCDKPLNIAKDQNMMDINVYLLQWFINFLIKNLLVVVLKMKIFLIKNWRKNYTNLLLENLIKEK